MNGFIVEKNLDVRRDPQGGASAGGVLGQDLINHPKHYTKGIECWDYITSHNLGYLEGNVIKYITRFRYKDGIKDLFKAKAYLSRLIEQLQEETPLVDQPLCDCGGCLPRGPCSEDSSFWPSKVQCAKPLTIKDLQPEVEAAVGAAHESFCDAVEEAITAREERNRNRKPEDWLPHDALLSEVTHSLGIAPGPEGCRSGSRENNTLGDHRRGGAATGSWMKRPWINE